MPKARSQCPFHVLALYSCLCHFLGPPNNPKTQLPALFQQQAHPAVRYTTRSSTYYLSSPSSLSAFWNQPKSLASICNSSSFQGLLGPFSLLESAKPSAAIYNSSSFQGLLGQTFLFLISSPLGLLESSSCFWLVDFSKRGLPFVATSSPCFCSSGNRPKCRTKNFVFFLKQYFENAEGQVSMPFPRLGPL